jgi:diguanylate cyclase (GGDEF)-like protein
MIGSIPAQRFSMSVTVAGAIMPERSDGSGAAVANRRRRGHKAAHPWRYVIIVLTGIVGALASWGMFAAIDGWQRHVVELRFTSEARDHLRTINSGLQDATDLLWSLRGFFEARESPVSRSEFQAFSGSLRARAVGLRDTGWAPRVTAVERDAFEHEVQATGFPDFQIVERNADGKLVRAGDRAEYFPILYSDPGEINRPIMGFDLASESMRNRVVARARATDGPAATSPIKLMNVQRPNGGVMSFIPVNARNADTDHASGRIAGVVLGAFETEAMIQNILATKLNWVGLNIYVFDPQGPAGHRLICWHSADGKPPPTEASLLAAPHWQGTLELVDQKWDAIFVPADVPGASRPGDADRTAIAVLIGGLLMTAALVCYLWFSLRRTRQLERLTTGLRETTEQLRRNGARLDHLARHDALTGLPNRVAFREDVSSGLRRVRRGQSLTVLYLDLDRFKAVNDTFGHQVGDRLLCEVADRMRGTAREVDTITRLGGDEFAIAQYGVDQPRSAELLARRLIDTISRPYDIDGHRVVVGTSVGVTRADVDDVDFIQVLRRADLALYAAKRDGRGIWRWFVPAMAQEAREKHGLEMGLRDALDHNHLELHYQPRVTLGDGQVRAFEALLRWRHPERGLLLPGDFIQCAEETGLIVPIGAWVLHTALREAAQWPPGVRVAVNLSPHQLAHECLVETIEAAVAASGQTGVRLELEIAESALLHRHGAARATLRHLRTLDVLISMDNFGTGYASLSHMRDFPFDRVKIDQSIVGAMVETPEGGAIVRAILQFAASLKIATTAEGVETRAQLEQLAAFGCDEAQGYLFSPPRPARDVSRLLTGWPPMVPGATDPNIDGFTRNTANAA